VELAPNLPEANDTLGWIYVKKGAWLKAVSHLEPAAQVLRNNPSVFYHLGEAYAGLGENQKAVEALSRAVSLAQEFPGSDAARSTLERLKTMPN
jgi:tetratricopeptide (TPR) repeat protein